MRNAQITGSPASDGKVYIAGLAPSAGFDNGGRPKRVNYMFRSTNGGVDWQQLDIPSPEFVGPGQEICANRTPPGYGIPTIWAFEGYGQPGVGPDGVVHYVYSSLGPRNPNTNIPDEGDILYIRSVDNGQTWSAPITLNTDGSFRPQWMPSLAVTNKGGVLVSWYDRRNSTNNSYEYWGRTSTDNGATWQADQRISDILIPEPVSDPSRTCFAGDYNYIHAYGDTVHVAWVDGRNVLNGQNQQDIYYDKMTVVGQGGVTCNPDAYKKPASPYPAGSFSRSGTWVSDPNPTAEPNRHKFWCNEGAECNWQVQTFMHPDFNLLLYNEDIDEDRPGFRMWAGENGLLQIGWDTKTEYEDTCLDNTSNSFQTSILPFYTSIPAFM